MCVISRDDAMGQTVHVST